ncbi:hypothetical protein Nepgr_000396 [Nepenthes gracilis]|uniref:Uncharacterized protein n=1 Tax=Nepenthes gracilis TaxID=150966 RepID=A0AAD3P3S3_NEPGR|nr:hypothetical protein Nepgr_000396 [Nepenthes gracilis]
MDAKTMEKSNRLRTQHHQLQKPHQHRPPPPPRSCSSSSCSSNDPKMVQKEAMQKMRVIQSSLPSNRDRHQGKKTKTKDIFSSRLITSTSLADVVKPESKGADFGFH